ncbi:hypothetical protein OPV22_015102 [Ensete ventricosum]|uniref:arogenate dehydratase n=1 Tax=Ensete ventricosum TaxID=4639 RepID=A0AAV8RDD4_ENSVE|nr:hypothetical protein OPV22_015102 [Ensete ventricosum]
MHGSRLRVAYQGVPGAYSESAAGKAYPNCEAIPCDQFEVAFQAVELLWIADRAVLPIENSLGGSIYRNYDLLLRRRLHIVGEVQLPVHHCLLALPGVRKEYLSRVMSHPQALAQCELTLTRLGLNVTREAFDDTAGAAEHVASKGLRDTAAIASARAAELYGLQVLADGIQDDGSNVTRFVMLAREPIIPRTDRPFKASIVYLRALQGALGLLLPQHLPDQDREPPPPPRRRRQRRHRQALRVYVLHRLPGVHGGDPRPERPRGDPGVHLLPPPSR